MPHLIEVSFKGNRREFFIWEGEEAPRMQAPIIVEADRGEDLGHVNSVGELAERRCGGCAHGCGTERPTRKALRGATADDERRAAELRVQDEEARRKAMEKVRAHALVMKVSDAEWQWDRRKLTFYFTAEKRVDFRSLVRDLAAVFRTRIELKQIGVRDEAKRLSGVGRCGREYCSASWLPDLRPVNLQIAKDQRLSLNPSQISGACGRLMCCLRYEHDFYIQARKRFPKEGRILVTVNGEEKVIANDIFRERVTLRSSEGDIRVVPVAELGRELRQPAPFAVEADEEPTLAAALDVHDDEVPDEADAIAPVRAPIAETATAHETSATDGAARPSGRRRGRRGGRRGRSGGDAPGSAPKD
jgi:cell fate regulator YaaT (PSP1 superfamily)